MSRASRSTCPVCGGRELIPGPSADDVPAHAVRLADTVADAQAEPRGAIALVCCAGCGFVFNAAFDPSLLTYGTDYESTQTHSPTYRTYADELVHDLLAGIDGDGAIVDVWCGQGEFLAAFGRHTSRRLIGFDPAFDPARPEGGRAAIHPAPFDPAVVDGPVSMITCKMTLEHVEQPVALLRDIAALAAASDARVFLQVPNSAHMFERVLIADLIYEHVNYFTEGSITAACAHAGLEVVQTSISYGDQHLGVVARSASGAAAPTTPSAVGADFARFGDQVDGKLSALRRTLLGLVDEGRTPVLWGAGSKAVALLALTGLESTISLTVDINPLKHGTFLPGSGIEIVAPADPRLCAATDVFVMNPIYADEIGAMLRDLGLGPSLHLVD